MLDMTNINSHKGNSRILADRISHKFGVGPFRKFEDYLNLVESHLQEELKTHDDSYDEKELEEHSKTAGEHHQEYLAYLRSEHFKEKTMLEFDFPQSLRSTFIVQVFSFLEFELVNICKYHARLNNMRFPIKKPKPDKTPDSYFDKIKLYLSEGPKIDLNKLDPEWTFIDDVRFLRNHLVHNGGIILRSHQRFPAFEDYAKDGVLLLRERNKGNDKPSVDLIIPDRKLPDKVIKNARNLVDKVIKILNV